MNNSVLVLGGTGFLGSEIIKSLREKGFKNVVSASRTKIKAKQNIKIDILDLNQLKKSVKQFEIIINCTGQITDPITDCFNLNSLGINNLSLAVKNTKKRIVHLSTVGVYGSAKTVSEKSPMNPESPYSVCKSFAEFTLIKNTNPKFLTIIRLSNVYGIHSKGIFGYLYRSYLNNTKLYFNNKGDLLRYYISLKDATDNIVNLLTVKNATGIYNLSGPEKYTIKQIIKKIEDKTGSKLKISYGGQKVYENIGKISNKKISSFVRLHFSQTVDGFIDDYFQRKRLT